MIIRPTLCLRKAWGTRQKLMRNGMAKDFSWNSSAREYVRVFDKVRHARAVSAA